MSAQPDEPVSRVRMSWQDYLDLHEQPEKSPAEWVAGEVVVVNDPPLFNHGVSTVRLCAHLLTPARRGCAGRGGNDQSPAGGWTVIAHLDDDRPTAEVEVDGVVVPLDLGELLRQ